jgi:hypothetical protein
LSADLRAAVDHPNILPGRDLLRFVRELLIVLKPALRVGDVFVEGLPDFRLAGEIDLLAVETADVGQVIGIGQLILCQGEEGFALLLRAAQGRDGEPAGVRPAKINAAGRDGFEDFVRKKADEFQIIRGHQLAEPSNLLGAIPNLRRQPVRGAGIKIVMQHLE